MNLILTEHIIRHIFSNLLIISSNFVNVNSSKSLLSTEFLLNETLQFEVEDGIFNNKIWGCQLLADNQDLKFLVGDCSVGNTPEYCLMVQLHYITLSD